MRNFILLAVIVAALGACTIDQAETNRNASGPTSFWDERPITNVIASHP